VITSNQIQKIFDYQQIAGNSSMTKKELTFIIDQLTRNSIHLMKKKDMLVTQKEKVDSDLKKTENDIKQTNSRLNLILKQDKSVSISKKKHKSNYYIKGRFWWEGKQRDVQIGSRKTLIKLIEKLKKKKLFDELKLKNFQKLNWNLIQKDKNLNTAVQKIGEIKVSGYILKKISEEFKLSKKKNKVGSKSKYQQDESSKTHIESMENNIDLTWYKDWKVKNFDNMK
jgi:hypothetical protein